MPDRDVRNRSAILDGLIKAEKSLLYFSQLIHDEIKHEVESISEIGEEVSNSQEFKTAWENFDQKANQLFNILSTVMKSMKEMRGAVTRNYL